MIAASPLVAFQYAIDMHGFVPDEAQWQAARVLQGCHDALLRSPSTPVTGVYLWGPVGRGKTWLMDHFFHSLQHSQQVQAKRLHFHHFMRWVHQRLFALTGTADPLQVLARELRAETQVLCFDELFVNDIGDAMILGGVLQALFAEGLVLIATSNQPPNELYANGFNRERLLPAIAAMERHMQIVSVDGGQDHRLHPGVMQQRYWLKGEGRGLAEAFEALERQTCGRQACEGGTGGDSTQQDPVSFDALDTGLRQYDGSRFANPHSFELGHLQIPFVRRSAQAIWFRFNDLCEQALAALDFITLCDQFTAIFLSDVPDLSGQQRPAKIARGTEDAAQRVSAGDRELPALSIHDDSVRRFIALVDECYDRRIPLFIEAVVPLDRLYTEGYLQFPFRRTLSRLQEMQLGRFGCSIIAPELIQP